MNTAEIAIVVSRQIPVADDGTHHYIVALDPSSEMPTDGELEMIALYQRFSARIYIDEAKETLLKMPLPEAPGHNTTYFRKEPFGDWSYRRRMRPKDLPWLPDNCEAWTLLQVLNDAQKKAPYWDSWKSRFKAFQVS